MKILSLFFAIVMTASSLYSQEKAISPPQIEEEYFVTVEDLPEPIGGMAAIQANVIYPEIARRAGIQGTVYVEVFIDENGDVVKAIVKKGIGAGCDESAIAAVEKTKFRPGTQRGKPVKVRLAVPIRFRLAGKGVRPGSVPEPVFTQKDYESLFRFLGMRLGQFRYSVPQEHELQVSVDTYQHGKRTKIGSWITAVQTAGEHVWSVILWEEKRVVKLGLQLGKGGVKGETSFKIVGPLYHHAMQNQKMVEKEFIPVYVFVSHPIIVPELDGTESIKEIIETYDQVLVVKALYVRR